jgi:hypothetical protein
LRLLFRFDFELSDNVDSERHRKGSEYNETSDEISCLGRYAFAEGTAGADEDIDDVDELAEIVTVLDNDQNSRLSAVV